MTGGRRQTGRSRWLNDGKDRSARGPRLSCFARERQELDGALRAVKALFGVAV